MHKWFKTAIFYSLDVETFQDSNGDGVGDFPGLISRLDYLSGLGVTCLWLLPFFPSPNRDNGYDVADYYSIDKRLGDLGDFVQFMKRCKVLGIKVIIDLVVNHTSVEHTWFKQARKDKESPFRDFYIWSDKPKRFRKSDLSFRGEEHTMWSYDKVARQYYLHRFYREQPDLNFTSELLRAEILKIIAFWLALGVDGFRIDAAPFIIETYGINGNDKHEPEQFLETMRSFVQSINPDAVLLGEANVPPREIRDYVKHDGRMHMLFNFFVNQHLFLAFVKKDSRILSNAIGKMPVAKADQQWLNFLRHHDELTLQQLSDSQQKEIFKLFAPDPAMRIYKHGIRRRLAPMVNNDPKVLRLLHSLLFSLPGSVLIRYGDEINMGDNLALSGRSSVRTPMQWSPARHAGFSNASVKRLVHPVIEKGDFAHHHTNVLTQQKDPASFLNFIERLITTRKQIPEIGAGTYQFNKKISTKLVVHSCTFNHTLMVFIHNLTTEVMTFPTSEFTHGTTDFFPIFSDEESFIDEDLVMIADYGFLWLRIEKYI